MKKEHDFLQPSTQELSGKKWTQKMALDNDSFFSFPRLSKQASTNCALIQALIASRAGLIPLLLEKYWLTPVYYCYYQWVENHSAECTLITYWWTFRFSLWSSCVYKSIYILVIWAVLALKNVPMHILPQQLNLGISLVKTGEIWYSSFSRGMVSLGATGKT